MGGPILAKDIMVTRVITLRAEMDLRDAAKLLLKNKISGAPVIDAANQLIGIFSEKDLMTALIDAVYDEFPASDVEAYMDPHPRSISEETDLLSIAQIFHDNTFRRLPVVRDGKLVGQISRRDVLRAVVKLIEPAADHHTALLYLSALKNRDESPFE